MDAKNSFVILINALISHAQGENISISKIEGRVKEREECIKKFHLKYRTAFETSSTEYEIKNHITDLIGIRVICLYEDDIDKINLILSKHFDVIDKTDKISQIENTEGSFGYKGLHLDLKLNESRNTLPEYFIYSEFRFEVQIRTIIQDSWSVLDHRIKYKKSIPNRLKRRINTLAALFELADREFREIRDSTSEEMEKENLQELTQEELKDESTLESNTKHSLQESDNFRQLKILNAFSFQKIAKHFFNDFDFEAHKVDGFTQVIVGLMPDITRGKFNFYLRENISKIKSYQTEFERKNMNEKLLNPYTVIRHCLYLGNKEKFHNILTNIAKERFDLWISENL